MTPFPLSSQLCRRVALANEASRLRLALENEATIGADGWVRLAPFGDHPMTREIVVKGVTVQEHFLQRLTPENARRMAALHNSLFGKLRRLRRGAPIYRRHPDLQKIAEEEGIERPETEVALSNDKVGIFAELAARADGFYGLPIFADEARVAIENEGLKYFSPFWWSDVTAEEQRDGTTWFVAEPYELISAALTDSPNLRGSPALANERQRSASTQPTTPNESPMKKKLIEMLKKHGVALENEEDATVESALAEVDTRLNARAALENEKVTLTGQVNTANTELATSRTALANEQTEHGKTRTALENEQRAHDKSLVALAIAEGRIAPSESATRLETLKTGGADARKALANEAPKYKVAPLTTSARKETSATNSKAPRPSQRLVALANELFAKGGHKTFEAAYAAAKATEEGQKLVQQIEAAKADNQTE